MRKLIEFHERMQNQKDEFFEKKIIDYKNEHEEKDWNGNTLKIEAQQDVFIYFSQDKKNLNRTLGDFDPKLVFSHLIYFCYYHHVANYRNGGVELIGFYDNDYKKVNEIPIGDFKITGCSTGCSFTDMNKPSFSFKLEHKYGNKHTSYIANAFQGSSCQKALDSIWELDAFYKDFFERASYHL